MNKTTRWITQTALLLALCILFQYLKKFIDPVGLIYGQIITGSLVNFTLIIAVWSTGFYSGATISILSAVIAFSLGGMPIIHIMPLVALGNLAIVTITWAFKKNLQIVGVILGAVAKFLVLWLGIVKLLLPYALDAKLFPLKMSNAIADNLTLAFSWPQLITALIGGVLALLIWPRLRRSLKLNY